MVFGSTSICTVFKFYVLFCFFKFFTLRLINMLPSLLVDKNGLKNAGQLSKPLPPSKPLDISNWQPAPPKWEKPEPSVEQMKYECEKFQNITAECLSDDIFENPFVMNNFKTFVYDSNAFEDAGEDASKTSLLIDRELNNPQNEAKFSVSELEVVNHIKVIKKAMDLSMKELVSIDGLKSVHNVLMEGVLESAGELRTCQVSNNMGHQYPDPRDVPSLLQLVIEQYQDIDESSTYNIYTKAAWLKCQFLIIHPFEDGNGRLSRILLAVMFIKSGLCIFPPLSKNGHKKSTKHYINSLLKAAKGQSESELAFFFLKCCYNIVCTFNCQKSCAVL